MQTFSFKTIDATDARVMLAAFEGDNEMIVADVTSNLEEEYLFVVVNHGAEEPLEMRRETFSSLREAMTAVAAFIVAEYEGS